MADKSDALRQLARVVARSGPEQPLAVRLCMASAEILGADGGAITLDYTETHRVTVCATNDLAARLEDLQEVLGEGPGAEAYRTGERVTVTLGEGDSDRWPMFAEAAQAALGDVTIYAVPMRPGTQVLGVMTLYRQDPSAPAPDSGIAQFLADAVGAALLRDPDSQSDLGDGPWHSRAKIHQATGMVVAQLSVSPDDALALLRAHAFAHAVSLDQIALDIVERRLDFTQDDSTRNEPE